MYDFNVFELFTPAPTHYLTRGHQLKLFKYQSRTDLRKHSFSIEEWLTVGTTCLGGVADATSTNNIR